MRKKLRNESIVRAWAMGYSQKSLASEHGISAGRIAQIIRSECYSSIRSGYFDGDETHDFFRVNKPRFRAWVLGMEKPNEPPTLSC